MDLVNGITLSVMAPTPAPAPAPPDTGNAGFAVDRGGASPWLALSLGLFALAGVAGLRLANAAHELTFSVPRGAVSAPRR